MRNPPMEAASSPSEDDLKWAAAIFEERGRSTILNGRFYTMLHMKDSTIIDRFSTLFGGAIYYPNNGVRWQIHGEQQRRCFERIRPYVLEGGARRIDLVLSVENAIDEVKRLERGVSGPGLAVADKVEYLNLPDPFDEDIFDVLEHVEPGKTLVFKGKFGAAVNEYVAAAERLGHATSVRGFFLYVTKGEI